MCSKKIAIIGHGGYASYIKDLIISDSDYIFSGFIGKEGEPNCKYQDGNFEALKEDGIVSVINGVGNLSYTWFEDLVKRYSNAELLFPVFQHSSSVVSKESQIQKGTVVLENSIVKANSYIGSFCILNSLSLVSHDCYIGNSVHLSLGAKIGGNCKVGDNTLLGINSTVINGSAIGKNVIIGAGSVIVKDVPDNVVVVGNPGKILNRK